MDCKRIQLYISKTWNNLELSAVITILLCGYTVINSLFMSAYISNDDNSDNFNKYMIWSNVISYSLLMLHSSALYSLTMKYRLFQEWMVALTFIVTSIIHMFCIVIQSYISAGSGRPFYYKNMDFMYLVYSISLYVFITKFISEWKNKFDSNEIIKFIGYNFLKQHNDIVDNNGESENAYYHGTLFLVWHATMSLILLGVAHILNTPKTIYYILSTISVISSIIISICEYIVNNQRNTEDKNNVYCYLMIFCVYIIIEIVNFFIFIPYNGIKNATPKNIFFHGPRYYNINTSWMFDNLWYIFMSSKVLWSYKKRD